MVTKCHPALPGGIFKLPGNKSWKVFMLLFELYLNFQSTESQVLNSEYARYEIQICIGMQISDSGVFIQAVFKAVFNLNLS